MDLAEHRSADMIAYNLSQLTSQLHVRLVDFIRYMPSLMAVSLCTLVWREHVSHQQDIDTEDAFHDDSELFLYIEFKAHAGFARQLLLGDPSDT